jgi:hypothetical protein
VRIVEQWRGNRRIDTPMPRIETVKSRITEVPAPLPPALVQWTPLPTLPPAVPPPAPPAPAPASPGPDQAIRHDAETLDASRRLLRSARLLTEECRSAIETCRATVQQQQHHEDTGSLPRSTTQATDTAPRRLPSTVTDNAPALPPAVVLQQAPEKGPGSPAWALWLVAALAAAALLVPPAVVLLIALVVRRAGLKLRVEVLNSTPQGPIIARIEPGAWPMLVAPAATGTATGSSPATVEVQIRPAEGAEPGSAEEPPQTGEAFDLGPSYEEERLAREQALRQQEQAVLQEVFEQNLRLQQEIAALAEQDEEPLYPPPS